MSLNSKMLEWLKSEEGQASIDKWVKQMEFESNRVDRIVSSIEFDVLLDRIIKKANTNDKVFRIVDMLFDFAERNGEYVENPISSFAEHFPSQTLIYKGYYFEFVFGQGTATAIYNKNKECIYQSI